MLDDRIFTRREIEGLIAAGDTLVIAKNDVLRLNAWQDVHPGGRLVIQHMVGRDATDELSIFHTAEIMTTMRRYRVGRVEGRWINFTPPIHGGTFRALDVQEKEGEDDRASVYTSDSFEEQTSGSERAYDSGLELCDSVEEDLLRLRKPGGTKRPSTTKVEISETSSPDTYTAYAVQANIDADIAKYPSLDTATQQNIALKFHELHQRVRDEGYYVCRPREYAKEIVRYTALFSLFLVTLRYGWYTTSACFLGLFWHQIMFTAHDAGHLGITHNFVADTLIGIFIADFCCGLSIGWWKSSHNVHHLVTNDPVHDPDIQNVPLFATSPVFFTSIRSTYYNGFQFAWDAVADVAVKFQTSTYYPIMALARFNLYFLSWAHLLSARSKTRSRTAWTRPTEILGITCYMFMYFYVLLYCCIPTWWSRGVFLLVSHLVTMPLHVQITLSHWGTSTADLGVGESFAQRQLRTTMDVACPAWLDFVHGGLQFQAIHHLFPRVPRHNLRAVQALVKGFCAETEIEYLSLGFLDANRGVLGRLQEITDQAKILAACQAHMAKTGESGLH